MGTLSKTRNRLRIVFVNGLRNVRLRQLKRKSPDRLELSMKPRRALLASNPTER